MQGTVYLHFNAISLIHTLNVKVAATPCGPGGVSGLHDCSGLWRDVHPSRGFGLCGHSTCSRVGPKGSEDHAAIC